VVKWERDFEYRAQNDKINKDFCTKSSSLGIRVYIPPREALTEADCQS